MHAASILAVVLARPQRLRRLGRRLAGFAGPNCLGPAGVGRGQVAALRWRIFALTGPVLGWLLRGHQVYTFPIGAHVPAYGGSPDWTLESEPSSHTGARICPAVV